MSKPGEPGYINLFYYNRHTQTRAQIQKDMSGPPPTPRVPQRRRPPPRSSRPGGSKYRG